MEQLTASAEMLKRIVCPAFLVKDGIVVEANDAALQRMITVGASVYNIITVGGADYEQYSSGKLYLQLATGNTSVTQTPYGHLFCMESIYEMPELQAFALAAQHLREPLSTAMVSADSLLQSNTIQNDPESKKQLGQINRSLYQLIRAVSNMSDAALCGTTRTPNFELCDATAFFSELIEKCSGLATKANRKLIYNGPKTSVRCMIDTELIERAVLNLISNAIKFSTDGGSIRITLRNVDQRLSLMVDNKGNGVQRNMYNNLFAQFLRHPGIEDGRLGIGLGLSIVRGAAAIHHGTVLLDASEKNGVRITFTISTELPGTVIAKSPIKLIGGYSGGWDNYLIELSDVLPDTAFETI